MLVTVPAARLAALTAGDDPAASGTPTPSGAPASSDAPLPELPGVQEAVNQAPLALRPWLSVLIPLAVALLATWLVGLVLDRVLLRRFDGIRRQLRRLRPPVFATLLSLGLMLGTIGLVHREPWDEVLAVVLRVSFIASITWLLVVGISVLEHSVLAQYGAERAQGRRLSRLHTQVTLLKRVGTALVLLIGVIVLLLMIPAVRQLGATILASAGLASIVVGLAVQGVLANLFAGLQLAFTDAIRVEDVVVVEGQQGRIAEITLTYVVVAMADGRNMLLPSTWFTTTPFENWSRGSGGLRGNVLIDASWKAPVEEIRRRVGQLLEASELWDGEVGTTQVTGAEGGVLKLTITVSARNSGDLYGLKNEVREKIIAELPVKYPDALPRVVPPTPPAG